MACNSSPVLEKMSDKEYVKRAVKNDFPNIDSIIIKDITGTVISKEQLFELYEGGNHTTDFYKNKSGEIVEVVVRKSTPADQKLEAEINKKLNAGPPVTILDIDCGNIDNLLEEAYRRDAANRQDGNNIDQVKDHQNLELVVSIDQLCGLPKGKENERQIFIAWLIVQHNRAQYRKQFINYFTEAEKDGALAQSQLALMKDRILMDDGKPQIYGSQLYNGELYTLRDASTVDRRRAEVGLEPLKDYLARFNLEFNVEQE